MKNKTLILCIFLIVSLLAVSCGKSGDSPAGKDAKTKKMEKKMDAIKDHLAIDKVKAQIAKLAPVPITYDDSGLSDNQKKALKLIVKAAMNMDRIFLRQVYGRNGRIINTLREGIKAKKPGYGQLLKYFRINFGPFDRLDHHHPFINLKSKKPAGAAYYPVNMTKKEFEDHIKANPGDEAAFTSNFTIIRRNKEKKLIAVPYSVAYKKLLEPTAKLLKKAAQLIENPTLKKYLNSRADAFASNDYYQSDVDWVLLKDHDIEVVIGPYEVYEDELFGYKAAFECFITLVDRKESAKLGMLAKYLDDMERNLPIEDKHKNFKRGKSSPIVVANEVFTAGDTKAGVQTTAFNLPNDERVRENIGSKKVMLKNILRAKFEKTWTPIAKEVLNESDLALASFDAFFNIILMHEIAHGLGPGNIEKNGKKTSVGKELKELYSVIEEAKADILGLYNCQFMVDKGVYPKELEKNLYATFLGGIFRSVRFGTGEAHGGSNAIQLNYIMEKGGFTFDEATTRFAVNNKKIRQAVKELAQEVLIIEALGDYDRAKALIDKYRNVSPQLQKALDKVAHVPVDIKPEFAVLKIIKKEAAKKKTKKK